MVSKTMFYKNWFYFDKPNNILFLFSLFSKMRKNFLVGRGGGLISGIGPLIGFLNS